MNGVVVVQFSENVIIPKQYNEFDDTILAVKVVPDTSKDDDVNVKRNKNLTSWSVEDFTDIQMKLKLVFESPLDISVEGVSIYFNLYRLKTQ